MPETDACRERQSDLEANEDHLSATLGQVPSDIVQVLEGLVVLFVAAPALVRAVFRLRATSGTGLEAVARGWNG